MQRLCLVSARMLPMSTCRHHGNLLKMAGQLPRWYSTTTTTTTEGSNNNSNANGGVMHHPTEATPETSTASPDMAALSDADKELFRRALSGEMDAHDKAQAEVDEKFRMGGAGIGPTKGDMMIAFTCAKCETRSVKRFSKHSYYKGIVVVQCPGCQGKHLIADHLGWFEDNFKTVEEVLKARGEEVSRASMADLISFS
eukprot:PhM_4_TR23/c0_g1_i1/m.87049/K17808/ZIM17, DNLZ, Tim15; mitochondrial protein import protein ZIM17